MQLSAFPIFQVFQHKETPIKILPLIIILNYFTALAIQKFMYLLHIAIVEKKWGVRWVGFQKSYVIF